MKKLIVSALASALVVGAASTSLAAQNPFSDVNEHHWAYNSVVELAESGVITGYDNSSEEHNGKFLGGRSITRYEMAQMIAKALARIEGETSPFNVHLVGNQWTFVDNSGVRRVVDGSVQSFNLSGGGTITRQQLDDLLNLLIEFRSELDTLGIRVKDLEDHSDMVTWTGEARYRYWNNKTDDEDRTTRNQLQYRIFPTARIDDHWKAKARLTGTIDMEADTTTDMKLTYIYAEGKYGKFQVNLGKMPFASQVDKTFEGSMLWDSFFSGGQIIYGDKFKAQLGLGRWQLSNSNMGIRDSSNYAGLELLYNDSKRFNAGVGYHHFKSDAFAGAIGYGDNNKASIISVGAGYKFGDFKLSAAYAKNTSADEYNKTYNIELLYKGANRKPGTWGLTLSYRYTGDNVSFAPTYDENAMVSNKKGVNFAFNWSPFKNTFTKLSYFHGKTLDTNETTKTIFGRVSYFF